MKKFLFKFLFNRLTYSQLTELVFNHPVVINYFVTQAALGNFNFTGTGKAHLAEQEEETPVANKVVIRLDTETYEYLESNIKSNSLVTSSTSDIEAGFKLGVQHVLQHLRKGYVIETR